MSRFVTLAFLAMALAACGVVSELVDGWEHAKAVEKDLETTTGLTPKVGFNWVNGRLVNVTVLFPKLYETKPLSELADAVRKSVVAQFKQTPGDIVMSFSLGKPAPGTAAELGVPQPGARNQAL